MNPKEKLVKKRKNWIAILSVLVALSICLVGYFFGQGSYSVEQRESIKLRKIDISKFADTDLIKSYGQEVHEVGIYQDQLVYFNNDKLWKVDPYSKKAETIELNEIPEDEELEFFPDYEDEGVYEHYAVVKVIGDFKDRQTDYTQKYYFGLVDLKSGKQIGQFVEFDSKYPDVVFDSGTFYIQGYGSPTAERSNEETVRSFILQIEASSNKVQKVLETGKEYERLYQKYFDINKRSNELLKEETNREKTKQILTTDSGYTIKTLKTNEKQSYTFPDEKVDYAEAYFAYSDEWIIEKLLTYVSPYSSAEMAENPDMEYEDITVYQYYLRNIKMNTRKKVNFGQTDPFIEEANFIRKKDYILWNSGRKVIKETVRGNKLYQDYFELPKNAEGARVLEKSDGTFYVLTYDTSTDKLLIFAEK
ncbi:hypothetical protein IGK47_003614 [Enterococcus sp. AZ007]